MILLIDNYDSFSYNLYQLVGSVEPDIRVIRNDEATVEEIDSLKPEAILLSPGPGLSLIHISSLVWSATIPMKKYSWAATTATPRATARTWQARSIRRSSES